THITSFFLTDPATTQIYTLSLHDALPICPQRAVDGGVAGRLGDRRIAHEGSPADQDQTGEAQAALDGEVTLDDHDARAAGIPVGLDAVAVWAREMGDLGRGGRPEAVLAAAVEILVGVDHHAG